MPRPSTDYLTEGDNHYSQPWDNDYSQLILNCILDRARSHPTEIKVFLSGNTNNFGKREVQAALQDTGVNYYFASTQAFLDWL